MLQWMIDSCEYWINLIELLLFYFYIHSKLTPNPAIKHHAACKALFLALIFTAECVLNNRGASVYLVSLLIGLLWLAFCVLFFRDPPGVRLFWASSYVVICFCAENITIAVVQAVFEVLPDEFAPGGRLRIPITSAYVILIAAATTSLSFLRETKLAFSRTQKLSCLFLTLIGTFLAHFIIFVTQEASHHYDYEELTRDMLVINLVFLVFFLFLMWYLYRLGRSREENAVLLQKTRQYELERQEYENLLRTTDTLRKMKHDMEKHLCIIQAMADQELPGDLKEYIRQYREELDLIHYLPSTGNAAIDSTLSVAAGRIRSIGVLFEYAVQLPDRIPLAPVPLASLLANLLYNAYEACARDSSREAAGKWIRLSISPYEEMLLIHIENTYNGEIRRSAGGQYLSVKEDTVGEHGLGIRRISDIVQEAGGTLNISQKDRIFIVHIVLPPIVSGTVSR